MIKHLGHVHIVSTIISVNFDTLYEPRSSGLRPGPTQTELCSHRRWIEA